MGLNKQKGNMYGFVTHTWNTIKGACSHNCSYCYMKRFGKQNPVRFDESELKTDLGSGNFIFVGSSNDMFANDIPLEWIRKTIQHCKEYPENKYLFQSKNPFLMVQLSHLLPKDSILCTTIESDIDLIDCQAPLIEERLNGILEATKNTDFDTMITIEPIMKFSPNFDQKLIETGVKRINVGANTSRVKLPEPTDEEINEFVGWLRANGVEVYLKDNIKRLLK